MKVVISSGHGKYIRGASGYIDEVDEARLQVEEVARVLRTQGVDVVTFHDDISHSQNENLNRIVNFHNSESRDLDVSMHFNAYETTSKPMGAEVLYVTQADLANEVVDGIVAASGLINRGPKKRTDLFFLNNTAMPAILTETCFVDSKADATIWQSKFNQICAAIAGAISGEAVEAPPPEMAGEYRAVGRCSSFGGPEDTGVSPDEGLAFISEVEEKPELFLPYQPRGTTGLARRLNPYIHYIACRWNYDVTSREELRAGVAMVRSLRTGIELKAFPADWGPHEDTGRIADLSPGLMEDLGITTDDEVQVVFPYLEEA
jgi:N-acetylmuramoyl-L-alanine amidase